MSGWYIASQGNSRTRYVTHDTYGKLHRYILGITDPKILVDHIDRNGLNCQKSNLRLTDCSTNKRNSNPNRTNKFNFNGLSFEGPTNNRQWRIKASYSTDKKIALNRYEQKHKSFGPAHGDNFNTALKKAVLFRIEKMREYNYIVDERSETIEKECLKENPDMEKILGISFKDFGVE